MHVTAIEAKPLRSLDRVRVELPPGIVSVIGPNGTGKTNRRGALFRSHRTFVPDLGPSRADPVRWRLARAEATIRGEDGIEHTLLAAISRSEGRRHLLDGNPADPATLARSRPPVAVFAPDRLTLVKGPPAERRAHLDGFLAARWPARGELRKRYGQAVAQRNALLARLSGGYGSPEDLGIWDAGMAEAAAPLIAARADAVAELAGPFAAAAAELGLEGATLEYAPRAEGSAEELVAGLEERRDQDIRLGRSSWCRRCANHGGSHDLQPHPAGAGRAARVAGARDRHRCVSTVWRPV